ncbi:hypothetical protein HELRODRAFT_179334 [Helobdella robusta]|uniref:Apple domain-containing protein n=1 Tax=Helobdella robusta TaxID=6412 RepID=T1FEK4_HELRO|nr:hypothetical protein HELRODRAFT_179334 [Helobdella robusta]ESN95557.1 hypothetical protein HELRODRAFT_179334 [Helobdella robusta]
MFNCVNIFIASIFLNSVSPTLFSVFSVYTNAFGLRACAADVANIQLVFGYNSCLKCAAKCSNTINCVGCNYQAGSKSCSLFVNCTKLATRYNTLNTCVLYQLADHQLVVEIERITFEISQSHAAGYALMSIDYTQTLTY